MYIVYIQQVVKVLKNIYVINYKSNDHPLVNSLLGRIIDRFYFFFFFFLGLSSCILLRACVCVCSVFYCVHARVCICVCVCACVASSVSDTQNAYLILFSFIQLFVFFFFHFSFFPFFALLFDCFYRETWLFSFQLCLEIIPHLFTSALTRAPLLFRSFSLTACVGMCALLFSFCFLLLFFRYFFFFFVSSFDKEEKRVRIDMTYRFELLSFFFLFHFFFFFPINYACQSHAQFSLSCYFSLSLSPFLSLTIRLSFSPLYKCMNIYYI